MSISNRHSLALFVSGESKPMHGQRLLKIGFKGEKKEFDSHCASVPAIESSVLEELKKNPARFADICVAAMESAQDGIAKALFLSSRGTLGAISDDDISLDACFSYLESQGTGGRLTKESLATWFDTYMAENLSVIFAEKLSLPLEHEKIGQVLAGYRGMFQECAAPKIALSDAKIKALKDAIVYCSEDRISGKILARFDALKKEQEEMIELLDLS